MKLIRPQFPDRGKPTDFLDEDGIPALIIRDLDDGSQMDHMLLFAFEYSAYAHLVHYGVCQRGTVPNCYGWSNLSKQHVERIQELEVISINSQRLVEERAPKGLLLEFIDGATKLSWRNITEKLADQVVRGLYDVHTAYVQHGDIHSRNILIRPDGRIVWIDFDRAETPFLKTFEKGSLLLELEKCWGYVYTGLVRRSFIIVCFC